ncbi:uncharacterized protein TNCV_4662621 [Trichonephila clavipes]|uniref:Uncharacterized protein n=1 Tax=Trichonephila clavipes TaxID=2585209 RepID=A0A8X6S9N7_TRICX|nr:uncharacterized protein TNCV_4662621 [Trichonephila clavipes]
MNSETICSSTRRWYNLRAHRSKGQSTVMFFLKCSDKSWLPSFNPFISIGYVEEASIIFPLWQQWVYVLQQQGKEKFLLHKKFVSEANSMTFRRGPLACCAVVDNRLLLSSSVSTPLLSHCLPSTVSITCNASFPFRHSRCKKK